MAGRTFSQALGCVGHHWPHGTWMGLWLGYRYLKLRSLPAESASEYCQWVKLLTVLVLSIWWTYLYSYIFFKNNHLKCILLRKLHQYFFLVCHFHWDEWHTLSSLQLSPNAVEVSLGQREVCLYNKETTDQRGVEINYRLRRDVSPTLFLEHVTPSSKSLYRLLVRYHILFSESSPDVIEIING